MQKNNKLDKTSKIIIILWSIPLILLIIALKAARIEVENFQGDGQQLSALMLLILPWYAALLSVIIVIIVSTVYLIKKKRQGLNTMQAILPLLIVITTLLVCMLIDGNAIALYFTNGEVPFFPPDPVFEVNK